MDEVSIVGVDLAKQVFQLHGAGPDGRVIFRKKLSRPQFSKFMASLPPCVVAMEACRTTHYWGRQMAIYGHDVRLLPPIYVKPFVKRQKNDMADAEAIAEAALRPTMRTVPVKTAEQQSWAMLFRTRELLVAQRTQLVDALRGHLAEHGVIVAKGLGNLERLAAVIRDDPSRHRCHIQQDRAQRLGHAGAPGRLPSLCNGLNLPEPKQPSAASPECKGKCK